MRRLNFIVITFFCVIGLQNIKGQVGIGNHDPRGLLDVNDSTTGDASSGLVIPKASDVLSLIDPSTGDPTEVDGTIAYDITNECVSLFKDGSWDCVASDAPSATVSVDCNKNGFEGVYVEGVALTDTKFSVTVSNNSFNSVDIAFETSDLVLSGDVNGITVSAVSIGSATVPSGGSTRVEYTLTGTPDDVGILTGEWTKLTLVCDQSINILTYGANFTNPVNHYEVSLEDDTPTNNDIQGELLTPFDVDLPYTNGIGSYDAFTTTFTGKDQDGNSQPFTISYSAGNFDPVSGSIPATITPNATPFLVPRQLAGDSETFATVDTPFTTVNLIAEGGILDRHFGDGVHDFVYLPIVAADGNTWLSHNLGANYTNIHHPKFNPKQQATSSIDLDAAGSYLQWGRAADGHEIMHVTGSAGILEGDQPTTDTLADNLTPTDKRFIKARESWTTVNTDAMWQTDSDAQNNPCPGGYIVASLSEIGALLAAEGITDIYGTSDNFSFTRTGNRRDQTVTVSSLTTDQALWWTRDRDTTGLPRRSTRAILDNNRFGGKDGLARFVGHPVRCIKQ